MSVRKRVWTTSKGEQREAFICDYRDQNGDRALQTFERKGDALAFWATVKVAVDKGDHIAPSKSETFAQAADRWLTNIKALGRERSTLEQYAQHVKFHILPEMGHHKVATLTEKRLEDFRDKLLANLSRPMARKVWVSVKAIMRTARRSNIVANVRIPSDKRPHRLEIGRDIPTPAEITRLLNAAEGFDLKRRTLIATATFSGLRASELLGLRWRDIDMKAAELHVRQRIDRYGVIGQPKSATGVRTIDLGQRVLALLREWKVACPKGEHDLVFPNAEGEIWHHREMFRTARRVMLAAHITDSAGEAKYNLHSLRHFFASWCINRQSQGGRELPPKDVQSLMGHSSVVITFDRYGHLFPKGEDRQALSDAEAKLWG